jgi:glutathione S-transferase
MKLRWAAGSPFVRKVTITAIETRLDDRIERVATDHRAVDSNLVSDNPLGKVPALIRDDGSVLSGSPVICAYLDSLHDGHKLIPDDPEARWQALNLEGLADGMGEAAIAVMRERSRPDGKQWAEFSDRQWGKFERTMDWINTNGHILDGPITIGQIALACAIGWTAFRMGDVLGDWQTRWPHVATWHAAFEQRPSMQATVPR